MKRKIRQYDFVKAIKWFALVLIVIVALNFMLSFHTAAKLSKEMMLNSTQSFSKEAQEIDTVLNNVYETMCMEIAYDSDLDVLGEKVLTSEKIMNIKRISALMRKWGNAQKFKMNYAIYLPTSDLIMNSCEQEKDYDEWRSVKDELLDYVLEEGGHVGWNIQKFAGENYLVRVKRYNERFIFCWTKLQNVVDSFSAGAYGEEYYIVVSDKDNIPYNNMDKLAKDDLVLSDYLSRTSYMNLFHGYILISETPNEYFRMHMMIKDYKHIFDNLRVQIALAFALILVMGIIVWMMLLFYRTIVEPIKQFTDNVDRLNKDETYSVPTHYQMNELGKASELLADLVEKIKGLKISIYEKTLEQQKIKVDFLTLQIEPHFYLNCLNIIYNMAQMGKYEEIQKLSKCVSVYLRYIFKSRSNLVSFGEELEHIKNYIQIQEIRYKGNFKTIWEIEDSILPAKLPPLAMQTFVENTIKHAMDWDHETEILIKGTMITGEEKEKVVLIVEDNGEGFEAQLLERLQNKADISEGEKRIGIMNVIKRFDLIFEGEAKIQFYNKAEGGAGIKITMPYRTEELKEAGGCDHESIVSG